MPSRKIKKAACVLGAAAMAGGVLLGGADAASASSYYSSFTVSSGSSTWRTAGFSVQTDNPGSNYLEQTSSNPGATGNYRFIRCFDGAVITGDWALTNQQTGPAYGFGAGFCYKVQIRRKYPMDTNGWWSPGSGNTTFGFTVTAS